LEGSTPWPPLELPLVGGIALVARGIDAPDYHERWFADKIKVAKANFYK